MSKAYQFPHDSREPNPFADQAAGPPTPISDNLYAAPASSTSPPAVQTGAFEQTAPHRGGFVLLLGLLGFSTALLALPFAYFLLPLGLFTLALSIPAWIMGRNDLAAMHSGAMEPSGRGATRAGWLLGLLGIMLCALSIVWMITLVYQLFRDA